MLTKRQRNMAAAMLQALQAFEQLREAPATERAERRRQAEAAISDSTELHGIRDVLTWTLIMRYL